MNDEQFDKEISALYQKRKSQFVAPRIKLTELAVTPKRSLFRLLGIFTIGGVASFGIMAIVSHFASPPKALHQQVHTSHQVNIAEIKPTKPNDEMVVAKPPLPPKPEVPRLDISKNLVAPETNISQSNKVENLAISMVQVVSLPQLKEPELAIKPVYKVMPKYTYKTLRENESGAVRLRYQIDASGHVKNIEVLESQVSNELQRSARKALAKWQYNPTDNVKDTYEIVFEFNLAN